MLHQNHSITHFSIFLILRNRNQIILSIIFTILPSLLKLFKENLIEISLSPKDIIISIIVMILFIYILLKKGLKVYKNGILNYSTDKVWDRFKKSIKN